jgi:hypothetical protein
MLELRFDVFVCASCFVRQKHKRLIIWGLGAHYRVWCTVNALSMGREQPLKVTE